MVRGLIIDAYDVLAVISNPKRPFAKLSKKDGMSPDSFKGFVFSRELSIEQLLDAYRVDPEDGRIIKHKLDTELSSVVPHPHADEFLKSLDDKGIPWVIVSSSPSVYASAFLNAVGIAPEKCLFSWMTGEIKPYPQLLQRASRVLGMPIDQVGFVGSATKENCNWVSGTSVKFIALPKGFDDFSMVTELVNPKQTRNKKLSSRQSLDLS